MYELYKLLNVNEEDATVRIRGIVERSQRVPIDYSPASPTPSLAQVFCPNDECLIKLKPYDRYLALSIFNDGLAVTAKRFHMSRMSLFRYIKLIIEGIT